MTGRSEFSDSSEACMLLGLEEFPQWNEHGRVVGRIQIEWGAPVSTYLLWQESEMFRSTLALLRAIMSTTIQKTVQSKDLKDAESVSEDL